MAVKLPNGSTFDVGTTYTPSFPIVAISRRTGTSTDKVTVQATGHTFTVGQPVLFNTGYDSLDGKVVIVSTISTNFFTFEGVDTTDTRANPPSAFLGTCKGVLTWTRIPQILSVAFSGGDQQYTTSSKMNSARDITLPTTKSSSSMQLMITDGQSEVHIPILESKSKAKNVEVSRLNLPNNQINYYSAYISISESPAISINNLITRTVDFAQTASPTIVQGT